MIKFILWYLKRNGYEYTIEIKNHKYMNYPNAKFGLYEEPKEKLFIPSSGSGAVGINPPKQNLIVHGNIRTTTEKLNIDISDLCVDGSIYGDGHIGIGT